MDKISKSLDYLTYKYIQFIYLFRSLDITEWDQKYAERLTMDLDILFDVITVK